MEKNDKALGRLIKVREDLVKNKLTNYALLAMLKDGFTNDQIALTAYYADLHGMSDEQMVEKVKIAKKQKSIEKEAEGVFTVTLAAVDANYTLNSTSTTGYVDPGLGYDTSKISPYGILIGNSKESIDPANGFLEIRNTDLSLPGRNGLNLDIIRFYRSDKSELQKFTYYFDYDAPEQEWIEKSYYNFLDEMFHLGVGWGFDIPYIKDGEFLYLTNGKMFKIDLKSPNGLSYPLYDDYTLKKDGLNYIVTHVSGVNYYFNSTGRITSIKNSYGNMITFEWNLSSENNQYYLSRIVDTCNRVVSFTYGTDYVTLTVVGETPYQIRYNKYLQKDVSNWDNLNDVYVKYPLYTLKSVVYPENVIESYSHVEKSIMLRTFTNAPLGSGSYYNLETLTNPFNGVTYFNYDLHSRRVRSDYKEEYYKVSQRYSLLNSVKNNYMAFQYIQHDDLNPSEDEYYTNIYSYSNNGTDLHPDILDKNPSTLNNKKSRVFSYKCSAMCRNDLKLNLDMEPLRI